MKLGTERVLTTHVGSLPRPAAVSDMLLARENGTLTDQGAFDACMRGAVKEVVRRQVEAGIDIVSDGEMSKIGYSTYVKGPPRRLLRGQPAPGAGGSGALSGLCAAHRSAGETPKIRRAMCTGEISIKDPAPLENDLANMRDALADAGAAEGFMNAAVAGRDLRVPAEPALSERGRLISTRSPRS